MASHRTPPRHAHRAAIVFGLSSLVVAAGDARAARPVAGSVTSERLKLPSGPNSVRGLAGEPAVDPFQALVSYQVPLELPAGLGGLAPSLSLTYSGSLGNGPLGIGWSLGVGQIRRSTRLGVPRFDATDELELVGIGSGRLVAVSADEYRVEGMGQTVRVTKVGDGFELEDGNGVRYKLGVAASARHEAHPARTVAWLLEEVTNLHGERIRYHYLHDQGQVYLSRITWGPGDVYEATFTHEDRADATRSYRDGFLVVTAKRLASVTIEAFGVERRAYQMQYDTTFPVARLAGVTATGKGGQGSWPALAFTYAEPAAPSITPITGVGSWRLNNAGATLVDLDGDGAAELLRLAASGHAYLSNHDGVFTGMQSLAGNSQGISALQLQDVDGDARPELLSESNDGWKVWKFSKTKWVLQTTTGVWPGSQGVPLKQPAAARYADLNGDGLVDAITWNNDGLRIRWGTRTGLTAPAVAPRIGDIELPTDSGRFHDVNGDGLDDYVRVRADRLDVFVGRGDGSFEGVTQLAYPMPGAWSPDEVELADLDRDGLGDLLRVTNGTVFWFRGDPSGGFTTDGVTLANPEPYSTSVVVAVTDSNGNGSQDVVWSSVNGMWRMDLAGATTAGMLTRVENGLGMDVTFAYRSSHSLSVADRLAGSAWTSEVPIAMPVPVQKLTALGPGEVTRRIDYAVRDGFWDAAEQRFGGFLTTRVTTAGATPAETSSIVTRHLSGTGTSRNLRGKPQTEQVFDGTGKRLSYTLYTWQTQPIAGLPDVPLLRGAILTQKRVRHEDTTPVRETLVTHEHDALGRVVRAVDSGRLDLTGDESVKVVSYADGDAHWVRDRVCDESITDIAGNVVSRTQTRFGDDTTSEAPCVAGKGWVREVRGWLAGEDRWVTRAQTSYDEHGNPVSVIDGDVTTELGYDPTGLFVTEERRVAAGASELVWTAAWDEVLGVITSVTDPNGRVTHSRYDALGRYTGAATDNRPDHEVVAYDWTPPFPKTTVWSFDGRADELAPPPSDWSPNGSWRQTVEVTNGVGEVRYRAQRVDAATWIISDYRERDPNSRVVFAGRPVYSTQLDHTTRPAAMVGDELAYDPLGRLIRQSLPNGTSRTIAYTAFERTTQEADLAPVRSVLDGQGRAILTERSLPGGAHEIVQASYDAAGRLTRMWLSGGLVDREFRYDTLGRLIRTSDPDLGVRTLAWDDAGRLLTEENAAGQVVTYSYDGHGRLHTRQAQGSGLYRYHYDVARPGALQGNGLRGRLAWVEEPTGFLELSYDADGRTAWTRRVIDGESSAVATTYAPSGLPLARGYDDGFELSYRYDRAGRLVGISDLWELLDQDASGAPLHERAGNGVETAYERDVLGLTRKVTVRDPGGNPIYDVEATRNPWSAITRIDDVDGVGLDHSASFEYDAFARLTGATVGSGVGTYTFGYSYDVLHNMLARTASGPTALGGFFGTHHYGQGGDAPRQLSSISDGAGATLHSFDYDAAGRQIAQDDLVMTYDGSDRLLRVDGLPEGSVQHAYGHDGARVRTTAPDGGQSYFFGDGTAVRGGVREHDVTVGDRVVARVVVEPGMTFPGDGSASPAIDVGAGAGRWLRLALLAALLGAAGVLVSRRRRRS